MYLDLAVLVDLLVVSVLCWKKALYSPVKKLNKL